VTPHLSPFAFGPPVLLLLWRILGKRNCDISENLFCKHGGLNKRRIKEVLAVLRRSFDETNYGRDGRRLVRKRKGQKPWNSL
jgi:hypothetical protein